MDSGKSQMLNILSRLSTLEQRERRFADEILTLTRENKDLMRKVETSDRECKEMTGKLAGMERAINSLQQENNSLRNLKSNYGRLEAAVKNLQKEAKNKTIAQEQIAELDKIRKVFNRAIVQNHQKPKSESPDFGKDSRIELTLKQEFSVLKEESVEKNNQLLTRIRTMDRRLGGLDAIEERIDIFDQWKETKESTDSQKFKLCDENFKTLNSKIDSFKDLGDSVMALTSIVKSNTGQESIGGAGKSELQEKISQSIFCAQLLTHQNLEHQEVIKINKCPTILRSRNGPFNSDSGMLRPQEDGVYNLGWKIHQGGDGKIRFLLAVEGVDGRIYLGYTEQPGDVCSGGLVLPLKKEQRVWLEAKRVRGPDPRVLSCNFMGWLLDTCNFDSLEVIAKLQEGLFRPIQTDCQHL